MSLKASNLSKLYDNNWILRDVSFEAERGEIFGLFGASGCGKTAILNILAGSEKSNGGAIQLDSNDVSGKSKADRNFAFAGQSPAPSWKQFFGSGKSRPSGLEQAEAIKHAVETAQSVLLIDDAFSCMDKMQKLDSMNLLRKATREKNLAIVFATSNFDDILLLCDKAAVVADSEIRQIGTPREVYLEPVCYSVARIAGRNNLFEARRVTSSKAETPQFQTIEGSHKLTIQKVEKKFLGALNQNVSLGIRPEHISISFGASFPEDNLIRATITGVKFLGATTLVELDADGLKLDVLVLRLVGLKSGDECMLGLPPDRIAIYKD
ncbi:MAG: ATP-binding cassette domain-containing protein [Pyrinomonadaceae bacterium]